MNDIFNRVASLENLFVAWREFRRGKRKKRDVVNFEYKLEENILQLHALLLSGMYLHGPYRRFCVYDPKYRVIHVAWARALMQP